MKKANLCLIIFFIAILFYSCSNETVSNIETNESEKIPDGYGKITFTVNQNNNRQAADLSTILAMVNEYRVLVYSSDNFYDETFSLSDTKSLIVKEGVYNSVIIADNGTYYLDKLSHGYLLGSGIQKNIEVVAGTKTDVKYVLKPFDYSISCPASVNCNESFDVNFSFNTRNDFIYVNTNGVTTRLECNDSWNNVCTKGTSVSGIHKKTAPAMPNSSYICLHSIELNFRDETYNLGRSLGNAYVSKTDESFKNLTWVPINFIEPESSTELNIDITWEQ